MSSTPRPPPLLSNPVLYQINCRVLLRELTDILGQKKCTIDDVPDFCIDQWKEEFGVDVLYLLGVWTTGHEGTQKAAEVMKSMHLPSDHICSSPFAVVSYEVHSDFGGDEALSRFRNRLALRGIRLLVDFVPNHVAADHRWTQSQKDVEDFLMPGNDDLLRTQNHNYKRVSCGKVIAHGKDPHFDGWTDTAQLNYFSSALRSAQKDILLRICKMADAVRCDMAMLVCSQQLMNTWGDRFFQATGHRPQKPAEFWAEAITAVKAVNPEFLFMAEVYWNLEATLMSQGFDFCYDKGLYDHILSADVGAIKHSICSKSLQHQQSLVRFLENHDEDRSAKTLPCLKHHRAAAALAYLTPGLKFFHWGQFEGRTERIAMQRQKLPHERSRGEIKDMYLRLLELLKRPTVRNGYYYTLDVLPSSSDSTAHHNLLAWLYTPCDHLPAACPPPTTTATTTTISSSSSSSSPLASTSCSSASSRNYNPVLVVLNYSGSGSANGFVKLHCSAGSAQPSKAFLTCGSSAGGAHAPGCSEALAAALPDSCTALCSTSLCYHCGKEGGKGEVVKRLTEARETELLLRDVFGSVEAYCRSLSEFRQKGIWFSMEAWGVHAFDVQVL